MQPTFIKIKFTPIIRHLQQDDTKCCLEIVPNVSCIQNLETIEWNNKNKLIEYSVPVTYKIILKKDVVNDTVREREKIYYSCIDLHLLSTNYTLACGDIAKVISDTYILNRVTADFESSSNPNKVSRKQNDTKKELVIMKEELNKACLNLDTKGGDENDVTLNNKSSSLQHIDFIDNKNPVREICTECTISKETITDISDIRNNKEKHRKLTITSVCTLNTIDNPGGTVYDKASKNNSKICLKYKSKNLTEYRMSKVTESFALHRSFYTENYIFRVKNNSRERILPELRVAHYMMIIENEILPLKILLSEIYRKCVSLGLLWKSSTLPESQLRFHPKHTDKMKYFNCNERKPKSNRVVYSIVFEEQ